MSSAAGAASSRRIDSGATTSKRAPNPASCSAIARGRWALIRNRTRSYTSLRRLRELGAAEHQPVTERGPGFVTASVVDPFGNLLGIMSNQHYLDVLDQQTAS